MNYNNFKHINFKLVGIEITSTLLFLFLFIATNLSAQLGSWKIHVPYKNAIAVAASKDKVYCASSTGIFSYDFLDNSIETISKVNGLNDVEISAMAYLESEETMVIGYKNGNIDLMKNNVISNLPDLRKSFIQADKAINSIYIKDHFAYLSTSFGIIVINTKRREISSTYIIGNQGTFLHVNQITILNDTIFAATENGIRVGNINTNLSDFQNWSEFSPQDGKVYNAIVTSNNKIICNLSTPNQWQQDQLYQYFNGEWSVFVPSFNYENNTLKKINVDNNRIFLAFFNFAYEINSDGTPIEHFFTYGDNYLTPEPNMLIWANNRYWIADNREGLISSLNTWANTVIAPSGPPTANVYGITNIGNEMWFTGGAVSANWSNNNFKDGIYKLNNNTWTHYKQGELANISDMVSIAPNPQNPNQKFISSWGQGLVEVNNGEFVKLYNSDNSIIKSIDLFPFHGVSDVLYDNKNVLWTLNSGLPTQRIQEPLIAFDGTNWYSYRLGNFVDNGQQVTGIAIDQNGYKWIQSFRNGVIVFDDGGTLANTNDDRVAFLSTNEGSGSLPSNEVRDIKIDKNNIVWMATSEGLVIVRSPQNAFNPGGVNAEKIIIEDGDNFSYLLDGLLLSKIYIDGGDRKWIGTFGSGVYLLSPDGRETIYHFTTENSPLLSNNILNIGVNEQTGEVYFATDKGLVSFKADAINATKYNGPLYAYPNPVPPSFDGEISIKGLSENAEVKITDITGNLVYENFANGSFATWNGKDLAGNRVQSGVYLVMASDTEGNSTQIVKILFINGK